MFPAAVYLANSSNDCMPPVGAGTDAPGLDRSRQVVELGAVMLRWPRELQLGDWPRRKVGCAFAAVSIGRVCSY